MTDIEVIAPECISDGKSIAYKGEVFLGPERVDARIAEVFAKVEALASEWEEEAAKVRGVSNIRWAQMIYFPSRLREALK